MIFIEKRNKNFHNQFDYETSSGYTDLRLEEFLNRELENLRRNIDIIIYDEYLGENFFYIIFKNIKDNKTIITTGEVINDK